LYGIREAHCPSRETHCDSIRNPLRYSRYCTAILRESHCLSKSPAKRIEQKPRKPLDEKDTLVSVLTILVVRLLECKHPAILSTNIGQGLTSLLVQDLNDSSEQLLVEHSSTGQSFEGFCIKQTRIIRVSQFLSKQYRPSMIVSKPSEPDTF
jgi:hypothetical protein